MKSEVTEYVQRKVFALGSKATKLWADITFTKTNEGEWIFEGCRYHVGGHSSNHTMDDWEFLGEVAAEIKTIDKVLNDD